MDLRANTILLLGLALLTGIAAAATAYSGWLFHAFDRPLGDITPWSFLALPEALRSNRPQAYVEALQVAGLVGTAITGIMAYLALRGPKENVHGDARWATRSEISRSGLVEDEGVILGTLPTLFGKGPYLRTTRQDYSNMLVVAPPGSGKTTGIAAPTLLTYAGSVIVLDVKGELFDLAARQREKMGDRVFRFSPYADDGKSHRYNPLAVIAKMEDPEQQFTELRRIASYLLVPRGKADAPFISGARELFYAVASVVVQSDTPTIGEVFRMLAPGTGNSNTEGEKNSMADTFRRLAGRAPIPAAETILNQFAAYEPKQASVFLSILKSAGLEAWADPAIDRATSDNDIPFDDLRRTPTSIFFCVRSNDLEVVAPLVRLFFQHAVASLQRREPEKDEPFPVLFLMDEFYQLGRMDTVLRATTTLRSYGGRMMMIVQGIPWLEEAYDKAAIEGLLGVCQIQVFMSVNDQRTRKLLSETLGNREVETESTNISRASNRMGYNRSTSSQTRARRLISEDEIGRMGDQTIFVFAQNCRPIKARKAFHPKDRTMRRILRKSRDRPYIDVPLLRDVTRPEAFLEREPEIIEMGKALNQRDAALEEAASTRRIPRGEVALAEGMSTAAEVRKRMGMVG